MYNQYTSRYRGKKSYIFLVLTLLLTLFPFNASFAQDNNEKKKRDPVPPPPYVTGEGTCVSIGVKWDEATIKELLPSPLKPTPDMTGSINICSWTRGYVLAPLTYGQLNIDLAEMSGIWAGYQAFAAYGPNETILNVFQTYYDADVLLGDAEITETATGYQASATVNGKKFVEIEVKLNGDSCEMGPGLIYNMSIDSDTNELRLAQFPVAPDLCFGEPVSAVVTVVGNNEKLKLLQPKELLYGVVGKNAIATWGRPETIGWVPPAEKK